MRSDTGIKQAADLRGHVHPSAKTNATSAALQIIRATLKGRDLNRAAHTYRLVRVPTSAEVLCSPAGVRSRSLGELPSEQSVGADEPNQQRHEGTNDGGRHTKPG